MYLDIPLTNPQQPSSQGAASALEARILPSVVCALQAASDCLPSAENRILTIVLPPNNSVDGKDPLKVHVMVAPDPTAPLATTPQDGSLEKHLSIRPQPSSAVILGPPRQVPIAKDSGWVQTRQYLEKIKPPGAAEVLLATSDGKILEGLVTNFYVIWEGDNGKVILQTAGMHEGVAWGTMRKRILEAAKELGIEIVETAPPTSVDSRNRWRECFISNSLRGLQPIERVCCGEKNVLGLEAWDLGLPAAPGPWTSRLQDKVLSSLPTVDVNTLVS